MTGRLFYGDCLTVLQAEMYADEVDLIYLDPPFNSNRDYNAIYKDETGRPLPDQVDAFCDTWTLDAEQDRAIRRMPILLRENGVDEDVAEFWRYWTKALRNTQPKLLAYLAYMVPRLLQMRVVLKPTGTVYLHCDPTASHYIKVMMDGIFGHRNFRNEIVWCYRGGGVPKHDFARKHDIILRYGNGTRANTPITFNVDDVRIPYSEAVTNSPASRYDKSYRENKVYSGYTPNPKGKHPEDWWTIQPIMPSSNERMGYPTQKPLTLMERIIKASSNRGDLVLDPFCGCATTLEAAHTLGREWIGVDIAIHAVKRVAKVRLEDRMGLVEGQDFTIDGVPHNVEGAQDLWTRDKYHFQKWAVEAVDGFVTTKRTADGGIDGRLYFAQDGHAKDLDSMVIEVKGGRNVGIADVRALKGVLEADDALMAGLIVLHPLGETKARNFRVAMGEAGDVDIAGVPYPRMQMLTVEDILAGARFATPGAVGRGEAQPVLPMSGTQLGR